MDLDLRFPVGLLFIILGLIMGIFGLTSDPALYHKSLDINVDFLWGIVELIFGSIMVAFGRPGAQHAASASGANAAAPAGRVVTTRHDAPPPSTPASGTKRKPPVHHG